MIEVFRVEIVDHRARSSGSDKRVEVGVLIVKQRNAAIHLIGVVLANDPFAGDGVIRFTDAGE
ncbi:hypothetical protein D3C78_1892580 [compost metagenome]